MGSLTGTRKTTCEPGRWTSLWDGPTWGFTYIWADQIVRIRWRRWASGIPQYMEGASTLQVGKNTILQGGPSAYMKLEVNPERTAVLQAT